MVIFRFKLNNKKHNNRIMLNRKNFLFICIICVISFKLCTAVHSIKEAAGDTCKCCKSKVDADKSDCLKTNTIRVEATVMTLVKAEEKEGGEKLEGIKKYNMDESYKLAYEGTFPVNEVLPIQIMLPESNDYQIMVTGLTVEEQEFIQSDTKNTFDLFVDDNTAVGIAGLYERLKIRCKDQ